MSYLARGPARDRAGIDSQANTFSGRRLGGRVFTGLTGAAV